MTQVYIQDKSYKSDLSICIPKKRKKKVISIAQLHNPQIEINLTNCLHLEQEEHQLRNIIQLHIHSYSSSYSLDNPLCYNLRNGLSNMNKPSRCHRNNTEQALSCLRCCHVRRYRCSGVSCHRSGRLSGFSSCHCRCCPSCICC
jgi:hypothetical protein